MTAQTDDDSATDYRLIDDVPRRRSLNGILDNVPLTMVVFLVTINHVRIHIKNVQMARGVIKVE